MIEETRVKHESFGFIRASRVQGHAALFDSAVRHQHYITIEIGEAEMVRRFSDSHTYSSLRGFINVAMSEAQFAQFITSMNVGSGAPCTLQYVMGKRREEPPPDINTRETFEGEVRQQAESVATALREGIAAVSALATQGRPPNKAEIKAALAKLETAQREMVANMPFLMKQFAEGIEKLTERAKTDLNAHAVMLGQRLIRAEHGGREVLEIANAE